MRLSSQVGPHVGISSPFTWNVTLEAEIGPRLLQEVSKGVLNDALRASFIFCLCYSNSIWCQVHPVEVLQARIFTDPLVGIIITQYTIQGTIYGMVVCESSSVNKGDLGTGILSCFFFLTPATSMLGVMSIRYRPFTLTDILSCPLHWSESQ